MSEIKNEEWEYFFDESYYGMWAIRDENGDNKFTSSIHVMTKEEAVFLVDRLNARAVLDTKLKAMQGLLDGQAVVIKELEDELEQVKFALEVESHDNNYNKDRYKAIADELASNLKYANNFIKTLPEDCMGVSDWDNGCYHYKDEFLEHSNKSLEKLEEMKK